MIFLDVQRNRLLTLAESPKRTKLGTSENYLALMMKSRDIWAYEGHVWAKIKDIKLRLGQHGKEMTELVQEVEIVKFDQLEQTKR
jgi:hypothetical protein